MIGKTRSSSDRGQVVPWNMRKSELADSVFEDFNGDSFGGWSVTGDAFGERPTRAGDVRLENSDNPGRMISVTPGQAHSGLVSTRLRGVLRSRTFTIEKRSFTTELLDAGDSQRRDRRLRKDPVPDLRRPDNDRKPWRSAKMDYARCRMWMGHTAYLEIADGDVADYQGAETRMHDGLGYVVVDEIRMSNKSAGPVPGEVDPTTVDLADVISALRVRVRRLSPSASRRSWPTSLSLEAQIPDPTLVLAIADGTGR